MLRFQMNRFHQNLNDIFTEDVVSSENKSVAQVLGELLHERELTVACAESCTGGESCAQDCAGAGVVRLFPWKRGKLFKRREG